MNLYLEAIRLLGISPNFWCSEELFRRAEWSTLRDFDLVWVADSEGNIMLPVYSEALKKLSFKTQFEYGFAGFSGGTFLDYEYIYNPENFSQLDGGQWRKVRKNLGWATRYFIDNSIWPTITQEADPEAIAELLDKALSDLEWFSPELALEYALYGDNRWFLINGKNKKIYAILCWDENWAYVNFRYCFVDPDIPGLSDYARTEFYRLISEARPGKLVNDGGSLDQPGLATYKRKLNPIKINTIYGGLDESK